MVFGAPNDVVTCKLEPRVTERPHIHLRTHATYLSTDVHMHVDSPSSIEKLMRAAEEKPDSFSWTSAWQGRPGFNYGGGWEDIDCPLKADLVTL